MDPSIHRVSTSEVLGLAEGQHGLVTRRQLLALGMSREAIKYRIGRRRLHPVAQGVYAVGRPDLTQHGRWMAAVLACGPQAVLSHGSAAALWGIRREEEGGRVEVSMPPDLVRCQAGVIAHRAAVPRRQVTTRDGIPVTAVIWTIVDLAAHLGREELEVTINEADALGRTNPEQLRRACDGPLAGRPGVGILRALLDRQTFRLTASGLERLFLPLVRQAGLPVPETGVRVCGYRVDFWWPDLGLVVETDSLRYHRTPAKQRKDRERDQAHLAAGLVPLRFTHAQVAFEPDRVRRTLLDVARRWHP